ncbi:MAG: phosphate starvation-inducible protein PhoH, partial [Syntrophales bacterium LBB04]|nr:phosphate starvation-inducible protein PhoH [Syntrophales bacterium LBB04]
MNQNSEYTLVEKISFADNNILRTLFGEHDKNIKLIEKLEPVKLMIRGNTVSISGEGIAVGLIKSLLSQLYDIMEKGYPVYPADIDYAHRILAGDSGINLEKIFLDTVYIASK